MNDSNFECFLLSLKIFVEETQERFNITEDEAVEVIEPDILPKLKHRGFCG